LLAVAAEIGLPGCGDHYYVSVRHNVTGDGVVLDITGWR